MFFLLSLSFALYVCVLSIDVRGHSCMYACMCDISIQFSNRNYNIFDSERTFEVSVLDLQITAFRFNRFDILKKLSKMQLQQRK